MFASVNLQLYIEIRLEWLLHIVMVIFEEQVRLAGQLMKQIQAECGPRSINAILDNPFSLCWIFLLLIQNNRSWLNSGYFNDFRWSYRNYATTHAFTFIIKYRLIVQHQRIISADVPICCSCCFLFVCFFFDNGLIASSEISTVHAHVQLSNNCFFACAFANTIKAQRGCINGVNHIVLRSGHDILPLCFVFGAIFFFYFFFF